MTDTPTASAPSRIDVHTHTVLPVYREAVEAEGLGARIRMPPWSPQLLLDTMDEHGIAVAVTSLAAPGTHFGDATKAAGLARRCNESIGDIGREHPRIGALATLPLPDVENACAEAVHALDTLGLDGFCLLANYEGRYLGDPRYDPLLEVLDQRHATVLIHPTVHPSAAHVSLSVPNFMLEYPFDTTRAAVSLLFADALHRFPNITFILSHGGGALPMLAYRLSRIAAYQFVDPPDFDAHLKRDHPTKLIERLGDRVDPDAITGMLAGFYYDTTLVTSRGSLAAVADLAGPDHMLFGSDWPYTYSDTFVPDQIGNLDRALSHLDIPRDDVHHHNALRLFPRFEKVLVDQGVTR